MKGLLLMFVLLSPAILLGQSRHKAIVDSIKAAPTIQKVSGLLNKYQGTKVDTINVSDSGGYVTVTLRMRTTEVGLTPIPSNSQLAEIKIGGITAKKMTTVLVPPPPFIMERDTIIAMTLCASTNLAIDNISFAQLQEVALPPMPLIKVDMEALPLLAAVEIKIEDITFDKLDTVTLPAMPLVKVEMETLPLFAAVQIKIDDITFDKLESVTLPPLPFVKVEMEVLPLLAITQIKTEDIAFDKPEVVILPPVPFVKVEMETLPLLVIVSIKLGDIAFDKVDAVTIPPFPEIEPDVVLSLASVVKLTIQHRPLRKPETVIVPIYEVIRQPVEEMHLSEEGYDLLEKMEGFSPELYSLGDGGMTIGFGFFVANNEVDKWRKGVTWESAEQIMRQKVPSYEDQVKRYINVPVTQEEFDALTMLAYNLGGFSKASSIVNDINSGADFDKLQHDWMRFVHSKAPGVMKGLMNRRNDEIQVRNASNYQLERKVVIFKNRK